MKIKSSLIELINSNIEPTNVLQAPERHLTWSTEPLFLFCPSESSAGDSEVIIKYTSESSSGDSEWVNDLADEYCFTGVWGLEP